MVCKPGTGGRGDPPPLGSGDAGDSGSSGSGGGPNDAKADTGKEPPPASSSRCAVAPDDRRAPAGLVALLALLGIGVRRRARESALVR